MANVKTIWTDDMLNYLKNNYSKNTNSELAYHLGLTLEVTRRKLYKMGFKRIILEYWTDEQTRFLKENYKKIGDVELAEIFENKWTKNKKWAKNHIEKKRKYLSLKRSENEIWAIRQRNIENGRFSMCPVKRWIATGVAKEGEIRMWRQTSGRLVPRIKINGKFLHWNRWIWQKEVGEIPEGMNVVFKDNDPTNYKKGILNLEIITNAEQSRRTAIVASQGLSDNYVAYTLSYKNLGLRKEIKNRPDLIELKRQQLILTRSIKNGLTSEIK